MGIGIVILEPWEVPTLVLSHVEIATSCMLQALVNVMTVTILLMMVVIPSVMSKMAIHVRLLALVKLHVLKFVEMALTLRLMVAMMATP